MAALMVQDIHDISRLLGEIEGTLKALDRRMGEVDARAESRHEAICARLDEQDDVNSANNTVVAGIHGELRWMKDAIVTDIRPVIEDVRRWRLMGMGAIGIIGIGGAAFGSAIMWLLNQIGLVKLP